jgi:large subunit ribosomal protein L19
MTVCVRVGCCEMGWSSDAWYNANPYYEHLNIIGGHKMNDIIKSIEAEQLKATVTDFGVGDTVQVYAKVKEGNRERLQVFEGTVLKRQNGGSRETFTVRKTSNGIGVEKTWPLHSPIIDRIEVIRRGKVRQAKLFYLRNRVGKKAKVKELMR